MTQLMWRFAQDRSGATSIEYAMIAVGIAVVIVVAVLTLGETVTSAYQSVDTAMQ
jgi:pilus assembly protein Flp/PilA